jgi:hypothetical protein
MKYVLAAISFLTIIMNCSSLKTTGTSDETISGVAKIYKPDGATPAINAIVRLYKVNDTTRIPQYQTLTDTKGSFKLETVPNGTYNFLVSQDSFVAYQDSIVVAGKQSTIVSDTLELYGSIVGYIRLQAPDDPRRVIINVPGTGFYANVDINNRFSITGLATGKYMLSLVPTNLIDYTPTFVSITAQGGRTDTLDTIEVIYNGIPLVTMLPASYDSSKGVVTLRWKQSSYNQFNDFIVYRYPASATVPDLTPYAATTDTFFYDTIRNEYYQDPGLIHDTTHFIFVDQQWTYRVAIRTLSLKVGLTYNVANIYAVDPLRMSTLFSSIFQQAYLHQATKVRLKPSPWYGPSPTYEWSTNGSAFTKAGPETTVVPQKLLDPVVARISGTNGRTLTDTLWLISGLIWEKAGAAFLTGDTVWSCTDSHWVWVGELNNNKVSVWKSQDCLTWQKIVDSLPFQLYPTPSSSYISPSNVASVVSYKSKIWVVDAAGKLQSSADGVAWAQSGTQTFNGMYNVVPLAAIRDTLFAITSTVSQYASSSIDLHVRASIDGLSWQDLPNKPATIRTTKEPFIVNDTLWLFGYPSYNRYYCIVKTNDFRNYLKGSELTSYPFPDDYCWTHYLGAVIGLGDSCFEINTMSGPFIPLSVIAPQGMKYSECVEFRGKLYNLTNQGIFSVK